MNFTLSLIPLRILLKVEHFSLEGLFVIYVTLKEEVKNLWRKVLSHLKPYKKWQGKGEKKLEAYKKLDVIYEQPLIVDDL